MSMQGCLWSRPPTDAERFIFVGDGKKVPVEAIGSFRLLLKTSVYLDLIETFVAPSFRRNLISIYNLDKGNVKLTLTLHHFVHTHSHESVGSTGMIVMSMDPIDTHVSVV